MFEDATIEDEQDLQSSRSQIETVTKRWAIFLLLSIAIIIFLYINAQRRRNKKEIKSAIRRDHVQSGNKTISRKLPNKRD
ncbi:unnamed protein product [Rotaria magnacalcarata]|uniref:Uncharacterized protein n=1 Tax=Rotaria magnacalcarata TaxID=392030 RepID=A0A816QL84_9BILA|nr:unnamed protein product [Rotaria magnacalcarata]CAF1580114.1 unnamed protein product [Rotaria magnacalcarata]CAF1926920.1 unnamed protein product [Rotaria magnacalcarata]CAF2061348.1 unnamed protein product [Rotaria magnacalcarata]CAF2162195.1 unnamed protein product [Rotaria magnacalcarata]